MYEKKGGRHYTDAELQASVRVIRKALQKEGQCILPVTEKSMEPALSSHDSVVVRRLHKVRVGEVVAVATPQGVHIHRVVAVHNDKVFTAGDSNLLAEGPFPRTHILGQAVGKPDVHGSLVPLPKRNKNTVGLPPLCFTLVNATPEDLPSIAHICETGICVRVVDQKAARLISGVTCVDTLSEAIRKEEITIGVHSLATREVDSLKRVLGKELRPLNIVLGVDYGFPGNTLSLVPHAMVDHLIRIGPLSEQPVLDHVTLIYYFIGLMKGIYFLDRTRE